MACFDSSCCKTKDGTIPPILLVDDEEDALRGVALHLRRAGLTPVEMISDSRLVLERLSQTGASALLLDLNMPFVSGQTLLEQVLEHCPEIPVIILSAVQDLDTAVSCMKSGAVDYLLKPVEVERLITTVRKAREMYGLRRQVDTLKGYLLGDGLRHPEAFADIVTREPKMEAIFKYMESAALTGEPLLITGETGTGKELVARAFHALKGGTRSFVAVNVAGLDEQMFADTLFGHTKGAFTGADRPREGMVAQAAGGTLFLDEIGDLSESSQVKLLRLLQERKYEPLGSDVSRNATVTVVAATHRPLKERMKTGAFRADLYYRLATHAVHLPPLRQRPEDLTLLLHAFVEEAALSMGREGVPTIPQEARSVLQAYPFPGNVRELRAMVFDAVARSGHGHLSLKPFTETLRGDAPILAAPGTHDPQSEPPLNWPEGRSPPTLKEAEQFLIDHALTVAQHNQGVAAAMLGLTRQALNQRLSRREKPAS